MKKELLISLSNNYLDLLPTSQEALLLIISLYNKVEDGIINDDFEQKDLDDTIEEVAEFLKIEKDIQKETLLKKLSSHYCHTQKIGNKYFIHLTVFAKEICRLLIDQIQPELKNFELYRVLKRTLPLVDEDLTTIDNFKHWHEHNFIPAQKSILRNTELIQTAIESKVSELRNLLKPEVGNPGELIDSFTEIFKGLAEQTKGLMNTLDFKNETLNKIKEAKERFVNDEISFNEFEKMQREIDAFFESIDRRVYSINDKIQLASKRLKNLFDTLKHKLLYKVQLEKFLLYLLSSSSNEKGEFKLQDSLTLKSYPFISMKFVGVPKLDFNYKNKSEPQKQQFDKDHEEAEQEKALAMLQIQESTSHWLDSINKELQIGNEVDYEVWFDKIIEKENNLEVPIFVCFGLIEKHNKVDNQQIVIEKKEIIKDENNLKLWKMKMQTTPS